LAGCSPEELLDFSANVNPLGPPAAVRTVLQQMLLTPHLNPITTYPDPDSQRLRHALADLHQLDPEWIRVGNGAAEWLTWAARDAATHGSVFLPVPAFADYSRALLAAGASFWPLPLPLASPEEWSLTALLKQIPAKPRGGTLWINNPHNPTGHLWSQGELLEVLPQFQLVIVDEAFMDFLPAVPGSDDQPQSQSLLPWIDAYPQLVVIRSLTKFYTIPGLRLGFVVAHPSRLQRWQTWRDPWSVNGLAQLCGMAALEDPAFRAQTYHWLPSARQDLLQGLQRLGEVHPYPGAANFLLVKSNFSAVELQRHLLQSHKILIRDCQSFPELGDRYFRVAVRTPPEHIRLLQACAEVCTSGAFA
jgi:L-threonine-O-3-phosphate decarboxylase